MTDLLGKDDYHRIAGALTLPDACIIGGERRAAASGRVFQTANPATGQVIASLPACDGADVDAAVDAARAAFDGWSKLHPSERKAIILRLAALIEENLTDLAVMESIDSGKTILDCMTVDLPETVKCLRWHAELIDKIYDQVAPSSLGSRCGRADRPPSRHRRGVLYRLDRDRPPLPVLCGGKQHQGSHAGNGRQEPLHRHG